MQHHIICGISHQPCRLLLESDLPGALLAATLLWSSLCLRFASVRALVLAMRSVVIHDWQSVVDSARK